MNVDEYLNRPGLRHERFVIIDNRTGYFIDYAYTIRERNEKVRRLRGRPYLFNVRWDFFTSLIRRINEPFSRNIVYRDLHYVTELTVAREGYPEYFERAGVRA
jgi:hypothetical protein